MTHSFAHDAVLAAVSAPARTAVRTRIDQAKRAYTTRRVALGSSVRLLTDPAHALRAGDVVLARVDRVGKHAALEGTGGRRQSLFEGDEIVVACAARYAPDQFDARVPATLGPCHLAAGGGVAGQVVARHGGISAPTELTLLGALAEDDGRPVNLIDHALAPRAHAPGRRPVTLVSLGTSMNAGKTTSAAWLIRGLQRAGLRVGAAKVTGTGSGNDPGLLRDAGAVRVLDFTDAGYASTCQLELHQLRDVACTLVSHLVDERVDAIVLEVADGLLQDETAALVRDPGFQSWVDGALFSAGDAMGASAGVAWLTQHGPQPLAVCGTLTRSPLARGEAAAATGLPVLGLAQLGEAATARSLWAQAAEGRVRGLAA